MTNFTVLPIRISKECPAVSPAIYGVSLIINMHSDHYYNPSMTLVKHFLPFVNDLSSDHVIQAKIGVFYHYINKLN